MIARPNERSPDCAGLAKDLACFDLQIAEASKRAAKFLGTAAHTPRARQVTGWPSQAQDATLHYIARQRADNRSGNLGLTRGAGPQLALLDREDLAGFDLEVPHHAGAAFDVGELGIVHTRLNSGDAQPLVVIDSSVLVVLALIGTEEGSACGRQIEFGDGVLREIPEARWATLSERHRGCRYQRENHEGKSWHAVPLLKNLKNAWLRTTTLGGINTFKLRLKPEHEPMGVRTCLATLSFA